MKRLIVMAMAVVAPLLLGSILLAGAQTGRVWENPPSVVLAGRDGAYLGVHLREVRHEDLSTLKLPAERGAVVEQVVDDSPASEAGLKEKDVIVEFDGEIVHSAGQLRRLVLEMPAGRSVSLTVLRDGERKSLTVKLRDRAIPKKFGDETFRFEPWFGLDRMPRVIASNIGRQGRLGVQVQNLTEQLAEYFKVPQKSGVLIASVSEGSPAQKAGLRAGDVIVAANGKTITENQELLELLRDRNMTSLKLDYVRNGQRLSVTVPLDPSERKQHGEGIRL